MRTFVAHDPEQFPNGQQIAQLGTYSRHDLRDNADTDVASNHVGQHRTFFRSARTANEIQVDAALFKVVPDGDHLHSGTTNVQSSQDSHHAYWRTHEGALFTL